MERYGHLFSKMRNSRMGNSMFGEAISLQKQQQRETADDRFDSFHLPLLESVCSQGTTAIFLIYKQLESAWAKSCIGIGIFPPTFLLPSQSE